MPKSGKKSVNIWQNNLQTSYDHFFLSARYRISGCDILGDPFVANAPPLR
jgi:hypothetical protein